MLNQVSFQQQVWRATRPVRCPPRIIYTYCTQHTCYSRHEALAQWVFNIILHCVVFYEKVASSRNQKVKTALETCCLLSSKNQTKYNVIEIDIWLVVAAYTVICKN